MPSVKVYVDDQGNVSVDRDPLKIGKTRGWRVINWHMKTDGWEITGITDANNNPLDEHEFKDSEKDGKNWHILDLNYRVGEYEYVIHVRRTDTGECKAHDPIIRNGGRKTH